MIREPIYAALFAKLAGCAVFATSSRRLKHWDDVPMSEQPALFQAQKREQPTGNTPGIPQVWVQTVDVYIYANTRGDKSISPGAVLNPLLDAIEKALAPDPISNKQTLGGLVQHVWIDGAIETDEGVLGDQTVACIPITIKVA